MHCVSFFLIFPNVYYNYVHGNTTECTHYCISNKQDALEYQSYRSDGSIGKNQEYMILGIVEFDELAVTY